MASRANGPAYDAVLFDMDGVLTATARLHEAAWKETFDAWLSARAEQTGEPFAPFTSEDYLRYLDGRLREDGVRDFLRSRGITLPEGKRDSPPDEESVWGLGNRKNERFEAMVGPDTVQSFTGSVRVLHAARAAGMKTALVSASTNARAILRAAELEQLFDTVVDGNVAAELGLAGKPAPDTFLEAARRLGVSPARSIVIEDAISGIRAAHAGGFGVVIGLERHRGSAAQRRAGAHIVVSDLWSLLFLFSPRTRGPRFHRVLRTHEKLQRLAQVASVEPWSLCFTDPAPAFTPQVETLFALSNGYLGIRGSVEEGAPSFRPAALLNGFHDTWPIVYGEEAYGFAHTGQTIVDAPDGMRMRLFVDDAHFDPTEDDLESYRRTLHLDRGELERTVIWRLHDQSRVRVRTRRIASLVDRHLACVTFEVEALDRSMEVSISSELADPPFQQASDESTDPRQRRGVGGLHTVRRVPTEDGACIAYLTSDSGLAMACGMAHRAPDICSAEVREESDVMRVVFTGTLHPGVPMRIEKYVAYHHSGTRYCEELLFRVQQTLGHARSLGADALFAQHHEVFRSFWQDADVELEGSPSLQFALRFDIFHLIQATARAEGFGVPAKGLTGTGYEGHYFWDTEMYLVPWLVYARPQIARSLLRHRCRMLPQARAWARSLGQQGAMFPWRTINGQEASANYAAGTAQYHINADIAYAIRKYTDVTGDRAFLAEFGAEVQVETARLWADLGFFSERRGGQFVINRVTGPDEYTTVVDNNLFTNLMARENLQMAASTVDWLRQHDPATHDRLVTSTGLRPDEPDRWRQVANAMFLPYDERDDIHLQDDSFLDLKHWDFENTPAERYPLLLHYHPLFIYRHQVIKQPDVMLAAFLLGNEFDLEQKRRIFEYYDPLTTGDSSLSPCIQAVVACEVGEAEIAYRYLIESAVVDLADDNDNVRDGIHLAACAGTWMAVVNGFAGMRDFDGELSFRPQLPPHWSRLRFRLRVGDAHLEVELRQQEATYRLLEGTRLSFRHRDETVTLEGAGEEKRLPFDPMPAPGWSALDMD